MNELFKNISWSQYLFGVTVAVIIYYILVVLLYFRHKIVGLLNNRHATNLTNDTSQEDEDGFMNELESSIKNIGHSILVAGNGATKTELINSLKESVANKSWLSEPAYRYALNNAIIIKAKKNCGVDFSEEELEDAWRSLPR